MSRSAPLRPRALLAPLLLLLPAAAAADEVILADGTRIVGTIIELGAGSLEISGGSAGDVTVPFENVRGISSTGEHTVVLADGRILRGRFETDAGGTPRLVTESGPEEVDLGRITAVNPPEKKAVRYSGNVSASAKATDGNTDTESVATSAEIVRRTEDDRTTLAGAWNYSEEDGEVSERNANGRGKYDYFISDRLFAYGNGSLEGDEFADLSLRSTVGAGVGYQFADNPEWQFYEEVGVSYIDEDFYGGVVEEYASSRFSGKLDWIVVPDRVTLFHFHEVFWGLEDEEDVLVDTQTGIRLSIIANFFASVQVNYRWDNTPASGKDRSDTEYLLGLGYSFQF